MLTDKCKKDFEKWFSVDLLNEKGLSDKQIKIVRIDKIELFSRLTFSMQYGVIVDFLDSVNLCIELQHSYDWNYFITNQYMCETDYDFKTRHEARTEAIKQANLIYNKQ